MLMESDLGTLTEQVEKISVNNINNWFEISVFGILIAVIVLALIVIIMGLRKTLR